MLKYIVLVIVALCCFESGLSLNCYVTDVDALQRSRIIVSPKDCATYTREIMKKFNIPDTGLQLPNSCYTMSVTTTRKSTDFVVKGCVPTGLCGFAKSLTRRQAKLRGVTVTNMNCIECSGNNCN